LPVRPGEAAVVAGLLFQVAAGRVPVADLRARLAGRASTLGLASLRPYFGSLEADPVHPGSYYLAADGLAGGVAQPVLLHIADAGSPASALFPGALLIGRMRPAGGREVVINCVPFGARDTGNIAAYAEALGRQFLPRPRGSQPAVTLRAVDAEGAFAAFRDLLKTTGFNVASFEVDGAAKLYEVVWAAIRAGWREGYAIGAGDESGAVGPASRIIIAKESRLERILERVRRAREARQGRLFDFELRLPGDFPPQACGDLLDDLREAGRMPHLVSFEGSPAAGLEQAVRESGARINPILDRIPPVEALAKLAKAYISM
jgi:hypothetical protein